MTEVSPNLTRGDSEKKAYSRRDFLKLSGAALAAWATSAFGEKTGIDFSFSGPLHGVEVTVDHVIHQYPQDLPANFDAELKKCDVFVPEWESCSPADRLALQKISNGEGSMKDIDNFRTDNLYFRTILKHLWGSKKNVQVLDIPQGDPLDYELARILPIFTPDYTQNYQTHVNTIAMGYGMFADWNRDREKYILKNLASMVTKLRQDNPLKFGANVNVFMEYGAVHQFYQLLKRQGGTSGLSQSYPLPRFSFLPSDEALRRYWFAKDRDNPRKNVKLPDDHLMASVVMEEFLKNWLYEGNVHKFPNSAAATVWFRGVIEKFNRGSNESLELWNNQQFSRGPWNNAGKVLGSSEQLPELRKILAQKLRERGVANHYIQEGLSFHSDHPEMALEFRTPHPNETPAVSFA